MKRGGDNPINNTLLRESTLKSVAYLQSKVYVQEKEVYELIRAFFKEYLGLDYEFTHDELLIELQNVFYDKKLEDKVLTFLRKVSKVEYSDEEFSPEQLKSLLEEFVKIVNELIKVKRHDKGFMQRLIFWKGSKDTEAPVEKEEEEEIANVIEDMEHDAAVDKKKGLFDNKDRPINNARIQEDSEPAVTETPEVTSESSPETGKRLAELSSEINDEQESVETGSVTQETQPVENSSQSTESELSAEPVATETPEPAPTSDLDSLIVAFNSNPSHEAYDKLSQVYEAMPEEEKAKYYDAVMQAFNLLKNLSSSEENS